MNHSINSRGTFKLRNIESIQVKF